MVTYSRIVATAFLSLLFLTAVHAGNHDLDFTDLKACAPTTVDGTQVFEDAYLDGKCFGSAKIPIRIADFKLKTLCSVPARFCVPETSMSADVRAHYMRLKQFAEPKFATRRCYQSDGTTWRLEMITGETVYCGSLIHGARFYDLVLKRGCVMYKTIFVNCVDLSPDLQVFVQQEIKRK